MIDQKTGAVTTWKIPGHTNVDALALDEARHRLFAASLQPGRLTVVDTQSGWVVAALPCIVGVDDIWFDPTRKRIYASGTGAIDVFQPVDPDHYTTLARGRGRGWQHELSSQDAYPGQLVHVLAQHVAPGRFRDCTAVSPQSAGPRAGLSSNALSTPPIGASSTGAGHTFNRRG